ncbi:MAG: TIGR03621 family F420-dependent LLM class oxidoreductase, partial [Acidimicrobiia bacterium]|nr:TIGR03621 family F420-dependent LLM class oxidoreductase [Acidimicrobiia bacterium]
MHPFRFGVSAGRAQTRSGFLDEIAVIEALGYSTVFISDHFSDKMAPLPALVTAAENSTLGIGTLVLGNDFRHPAVLAKEAATVDLLSGGLLELGIGTGWDISDYEASGIEKVEPGDQVDRFEEAITILKRLWNEGELDFDGTHYSVHLNGLPKPGPGRPRLLIGGGAQRMLGIAGREADIVGISAAEISNRSDLATEIARAGDLLDQKLDWVKEGAGDRFEQLEINILLFGVSVTSDREAGLAQMAGTWGTSTEAIASSPHFLVGNEAQIIDDLTYRRERWEISYPV